MTNLTIRETETLPQRLSKWESACNEITNYANVPGLADEKRAELVSLIDELRRGLIAASPDEISREIAKLAMGCKMGAADQMDRKAFMSILLEHSLGYPLDIVRSAAYEWTHANTFFPSIGEFCGLCEPKFQRRRHLMVQFQNALAKSDKKRAEAAEEATRKDGWRDRERREELELKVREAKNALAENSARVFAKRKFVPLPNDERERLLNKLASRA